jgi:hypothetical protein
MKTSTTIAILLMTACSLPNDLDLKDDSKKSDHLSESNRCALTPDPGPCKAFFKRYYFDAAEGKCKEFIWGGCDGVVPFETLLSCQECAH